MTRITLILLCLIAGSVQADTFAYGRDGTTEALDVSVRGGADSTTNFYDQLQLRNHITRSDTTATYQTSFIWFDCATDISGATVDSAFLTLQPDVIDGDPGTDTLLIIRRMLVAWTHNQATARNRQTSTPWNAFGGWGAGTDYTTTGQVSKDIGAVETDVRYDVTTIVQAWADGSSNYGFGVYGGGNAGIIAQLYAADNGTQAARPLLTIYTSAGGPPASGGNVIRKGTIRKGVIR